MQSRNTQIGLTVQIFLSYCLAGILAAIVLIALSTMHLHALTLIAGAGLASGLVGLLLTFNIQRGLYYIDRAMVCLAHGQSVGQFETGWLWPLNTLFTRVRQLSQVLEEQAQRETLTAEQRAQLLRTVSEAAAQEERNRLARELHDSIKQQIFSIGMSAAAIEARLTGGLGMLETPLADIQQSVEAAQGEMDALVQQLRPATLSLTGVVENLRTQCQALAYRINGQASVEVGQLPLSEFLPPATGDALQRIVQEALSNIARHARAHKINLYLGQQEDSLLVELRDDGQGFSVDEPKAGMGLANMRARASSLGGNLHIQSGPDGTTLSLSLPLVVAPTGPLAEQRKAIESQARHAHTLNERADLFLQLTFLCILLALPFALIGLGLCLTLVFFALAYDGRKRIVELASTTSKEALALSSRGYDSAISLFLLFALCIWYLPVALPGRSLLLLTSLSAGISLVAVVLALLAGWKYQTSTAAYVRHLARKERADEEKHRLRQLQINLGIWLVIVILAFFFGQLDLAFPLHTASQWSSGATVVLLVLWPMLILVNYLQNHLLFSQAGTFEKKGESV